MKGNNQMWRLDLLEAKFQELPPRFPHTKKLLLASKHNNKLAKKLPKNKEEALEEIAQLKAQFFENKYHSGYKKLDKEVRRLTKQKTKKDVPEVFNNEEFINQLITSRLIKSISSTILTNKELKANPPVYIKDSVRDTIKDKANPCNPSQFFIAHCQNSKEVNNYCSNLWNTKEMKTILNDIDWSFRQVRGSLTKTELEERSRQTGKASDTGDNEGTGTDEESSSEGANSEDDESSDEDDGTSSSGLEHEGKDGIHNGIQDDGSDIDEELEAYAQYDKWVVASDQEDIDEKQEEEFELDPNVNYNEVTDEEPLEDDEEYSGDESDPTDEAEDKDEQQQQHEEEEEEEEDDDDSSVDDFFEEEPPKKKSKKTKETKDDETRYKLPALATGYYSGGSDDEDEIGDVDNDRVVKELTQQRKNRRGQRARQKIWEKKYGSKAKHIVKDKERIQNEREIRQKEYEERQRKRELKAKLLAEKQKPTGSNMEPLGERKSRSANGTRTAVGVVGAAPAAEKLLHPSWEAKKQAEAKMKNVKFQGKKITFD
ncbi:hypothetical protein LELG_00230 [Lodderomyces elongisporus NRRL YB-4239]|uniref:Bud22 domain-containing protein n=1 Tax=Lodderomyces elongisporus (strain ATCC 11503 / CBS 2605 / JCM 1781 / NBRC 1676 / NRRL YB-4239) TaxID=379508 RepID=A5DS94_LODEL|nr:hypothetical protein LELG_00230 [Lodderomyces elongisporus NRRL YB-4239]